MTYTLYMSLRLRVSLWYFEVLNTPQSQYLEDPLIEMVQIHLLGKWFHKPVFYILGAHL